MSLCVFVLLRSQDPESLHLSVGGPETNMLVYSLNVCLRVVVETGDVGSSGWFR